MKKIILLFLLTTIMMPCIAQDDLYYIPKKQKLDTLTYSSEISSLRYNIRKYHNERQIAWTLAGTGALISGLGVATTEYSPEMSKYLFLISAISGTASVIVFFDSDKWLKRASMGIYPGGIRIKF
ncbi:MAG TPA: hypothetical protein VMW32_00750 [Bacteroidales bacterium]|nr:hypothetical protein [Bacteroidales bacterium]